MGQVVLFSLTSALNPTLLAATTLMLLLPNPAPLMLGYLVGAMLTSITLGLVILFSLESTGAPKTVQHTLSPAADLALGALALIVARVLWRDRFGRGPDVDAAAPPAREKRPPRWQRALSGGSTRTTFVVGAVLSLPGASYLAALHGLRLLHDSRGAEIVVVICINLVMFILLEAPLVSFAIAPEWTPRAIERAKSALHRHWRTLAARGLALVGAALALKGVIGLLAR